MKKFWVLFLGMLVVACTNTTADPVPVHVSTTPVEAQLSLSRAPQESNKHKKLDSFFLEADKRTPEQIAIAACQTPKGEWRCKGIKRPLAAGQVPVFPTAWTVSAWAYDTGNASTCASDGNSCTSTTCGAAGSGIGPCATWQEIYVHRWDCLGTPAACPRLRQATTVTGVSNATDNSDPISVMPQYENGGFLAFTGNTTNTAAVFTLNAAKNRTAGSNAMLSGSFSAGTPATGVMVQNTTAAKSSIAEIHTTAGGANWNLTQPLAPLTFPTTTLAPAELDTWASTDTVNLVTLTKMNIVRFTPTIIDANGAGSNFGYLSNLRVFDPQGNGADQIVLNGAVQSQQVVFERGVSFMSMQGTIAIGNMAHDVGFINCYFLGGLFSTAHTDTFFVVGGGTNNFTNAAGEANFDGDYIAGGFGFNAIANTNVGIGFVFLDANSQWNTGSVIRFTTGQYGGHVLYGTTGKTMNFKDKSTGLMSGTFTNGWTQATLVSTGVQLNGASTGCSHSNANNPDVQNCAISTTVAHLDAAQGIAGFGGTGFNPGGASVSNIYQ